MHLDFKKHIFRFVVLVNCFFSYGQIGGVNTFEFLNLTTSPKTIALGGYAISVIDNDVNNGIYNPATINSSMNSNIVLNYTNYYSDIMYGNVGYSFELLDYQFVTSLKFIDYGTFIETNEFGQDVGSFSAGEYLFSIGSSNSILDSLCHIGVNAKLAYSSLYEIHSLGSLIDLGVVYNFRNQNLAASILLKNLGYQIVPYYANNRESLPFEITIGLSSKLKHMPLRWHLTLQHVETPDLLFDNAYSDQVNNNIGYGILRHVVFGGELLLHKNVNLLFGYNNRKRFEMIIEDRKGLVGFSCGVLLKINRFSIMYSRSSHHLSGPLNSFGISTNLKKID